MAIDTSTATATMSPATLPAIPLPAAPAVTVQQDPARQPSLDPSAASPYTPLALPPVDAGQGLAAALPKQDEPQPLGAVSHGGAIAYMLDKVFRGAIQGHDAAIADNVTVLPEAPVELDYYATEHGRPAGEPERVKPS